MADRLDAVDSSIIALRGAETTQKEAKAQIREAVEELVKKLENSRVGHPSYNFTADGNFLGGLQGVGLNPDNSSCLPIMIGLPDDLKFPGFDGYISRVVYGEMPDKSKVVILYGVAGRMAKTAIVDSDETLELACKGIVKALSQRSEQIKQQTPISTKATALTEVLKAI